MTYKRKFRELFNNVDPTLIMNLLSQIYIQRSAKPMSGMVAFTFPRPDECVQGKSLKSRVNETEKVKVSEITNEKE